MPTGFRYAEYVIYRIFPRRSPALNQSAAEAGLLDLSWFDAVARDVVNAVFRPQQLTKPHKAALTPPATPPSGPPSMR